MRKKTRILLIVAAVLCILAAGYYTLVALLVRGVR